MPGGLRMIEGETAGVRLQSRTKFALDRGQVCFGKWGEGDYAGGKPDGGYKCRSKKDVKRLEAQ